MITRNNTLQYVEEHLSCDRYISDVTNGFIYKEFAAGEKLIEDEGLERNYLIMVIEGNIEICCNSYSNRIIKSGEIFVVSQTSVGTFKTLANTRLLLWGFEVFVSSCDRFFIDYLYRYKKEIDYNLDTLPICQTLEMFINTMSFYLINKVSCAHLHEAKDHELGILLRCFYKKEELAHLFYPILNEDHDFKLLIYKNYKKAKTAKELIALSNMSRSVFYKRFKKTFHVSIKQWLLKKKLYSIAYKASYSSCTISTLIIDFDFYSLSQFQSFCKKYWGLTPSELIDSCKCRIIPKCKIPDE